MLLTACANGTPTNTVINIPASLFDTGTPGIVADAATATQDDFNQAYFDTYIAWEKCADNLKQIQHMSTSLPACHAGEKGE